MLCRVSELEKTRCMQKRTMQDHLVSTVTKNSKLEKRKSQELLNKLKYFGQNHPSIPSTLKHGFHLVCPLGCLDGHFANIIMQIEMSIFHKMIKYENDTLLHEPLNIFLTIYTNMILL